MDTVDGGVWMDTGSRWEEGSVAHTRRYRFAPPTPSPPQPPNNQTNLVKRFDCFFYIQVQIYISLREGLKKIWKFLMAFDIKRRPPPPALMALVSTHFSTPIFCNMCKTRLTVRE